ncbi:MAG: flavodoxin family protein [Methanomassiliicoccaceae archaeon]|jgi:multimeric flavodoxin WrbA|nr:flavodoxin family protein [Methanomassiliicoccaceae archaeon]
MKVTIFNGSPRKNGNTAAMTSSLKEKIITNGGAVKEHFLYHMNIKGCMNCDVCHSSAGLKECAIKDDAIPLLKEFVSSDIIILATPIYMWHMTASMNAFIERLHSLCRHEEPAVNKMDGKRIAIAMTMGDDEYVAGDVVNSLLFFCEYFKLRYAGAFAVPFCDKEQIMRPLYQEKMQDFVEKIMKK